MYSTEADLVKSGADVESVVESVVREVNGVGVDDNTDERQVVVELDLPLIMVSARRTVLEMRVLSTLMAKIMPRLGHIIRLALRITMIWATWLEKKVYFSRN